METPTPSSDRESRERMSVKSPLIPRYSFPRNTTNIRREKNFSSASTSSLMAVSFRFFAARPSLSISLLLRGPAPAENRPGGLKGGWAGIQQQLRRRVLFPGPERQRFPREMPPDMLLKPL